MADFEGGDFEGEGGYEETAGELAYECVALYAYTASSPGELSFNVGDTIIVTSDNKEGWYSATVNGVQGFVPANYVGMKEDNNDAAARKAKRQKMLAERRELKAVVDEKRARRMQLEEEVKYLEDYNRERKALIKRLVQAKGSENSLFVLYDLITLALATESLADSQAAYAERTSTLVMVLSSIQGLISKDIQPGHPLESTLRKVSESIASTKQTYTKSGEKLTTAILARKEFEQLLEKVRSALAQNFGV